MKTPENEDREAQAAREVGLTEVSPIVARALSAVFLLAILAVPLIETVRDVKSPGRIGRNSSRLPLSPRRPAGSRGCGRRTANSSHP